MTSTDLDLFERALEHQRDEAAREFALTVPAAFWPEELRALYDDTQELYALGRYADSGAAWAMFVDMAEARGLI